MFQTLIAQIKEYKKPSILASLFMTLEVMFEISIPFVMANLLDKGVQQSNMSNIWLYGGLMLVCRFSVGRSRHAMRPLLLLDLPRIYVKPFSKRFKPSLLKISISSQLVVW